MKSKLMLLNLFLIVSSVFLASQHTLAEEACKRQEMQLNWRSIESEEAAKEITFMQGGIITVSTSGAYEKIKAELPNGDEIVLEPVRGSFRKYRAFDVPNAKLAKIDRAKWQGFKSRSVCVETYTQQELAEKAVLARELEVIKKRRQILRDGCVVKVFPAKPDAVSSSLYEGICEVIAVAISENNTQAIEQIRDRIKSRLVAEMLCILKTLNGRTNTTVVDSARRLCSHETASVTNENPSSYSLKTHLPAAHLFLEANL